jgi:hypothetical protein
VESLPAGGPLAVFDSKKSGLMGCPDSAFRKLQLNALREPASAFSARLGDSAIHSSSTGRLGRWGGTTHRRYIAATSGALLLRCASPSGRRHNLRRRGHRVDWPVISDWESELLPTPPTPTTTSSTSPICRPAPRCRLTLRAWNGSAGRGRGTHGHAPVVVPPAPMALTDLNLRCPG